MISIGVDVSKLTFETAEQGGDGRYKSVEYLYDGKGLKECIATLREKKGEVLVTMEATGRYHLRLAESLYGAGFRVSVVNPLVIKRYGEMKLRRVKSDKADAQLIAEYGANEEPVLFKPLSKKRRKIMEILRGIDDFTIMQTQIQGRLEALSIMPEPCEEVIACFEENLEHLRQSIKKLEKQIQDLIVEEHMETYQLARSIPGIGNRIAALSVALFGDFADFANAGQVACYIGLTPYGKQSGTSVRVKGPISKQGSAYARKLFYLASLSASRWNPHCTAFYQRLLAKGKAKRVAHIAVAHKLVRQVFGVVKSKRAYDPNYVGRRKK